MQTASTTEIPRHASDRRILGCGARSAPVPLMRCKSPEACRRKPTGSSTHAKSSRPIKPSCVLFNPTPQLDKHDDDDKADSQATHGQTRRGSRTASLLAGIRQDRRAMGDAYTAYAMASFNLASAIMNRVQA